MANQQSKVYKASDFNVTLVSENGVPYLFTTTVKIGQKISQPSERVWAVGQTNAIANQPTAEDITGNIEFQVGELANLLATFGLVSGNNIKNATLAITAINASVPTPFARSYSTVNIESENIDIAAKQSNVTVTMDWSAVGVI